MNLEEIKKDKEQLEGDINKVISTFMKKYPTLLPSISVDIEAFYIESLVEPVGTIIKVKAKIEL